MWCVGIISDNVSNHYVGGRYTRIGSFGPSSTSKKEA
jgi:hypothetical protein